MVMVLAPARSRARVVPIRGDEDGSGLELSESDEFDIDALDDATLEAAEDAPSDADEEQVEA
jgi:hypothetical protein